MHIFATRDLHVDNIVKALIHELMNLSSQRLKSYKRTYDSKTPHTKLQDMYDGRKGRGALCQRKQEMLVKHFSK